MEGIDTALLLKAPFEGYAIEAEVLPDNTATHS
jgi:hypothetical protein